MAKVYKGHYDNTKLINSLDADGERPCFYCVVSLERGPGKSYSFSKLLYENFENNGDKFILLTRHKKDLGTIADGMFEGYFQVEHPECSMKEVLRMGHTFSDIYIESGNGDEKSTIHCGWVIPLSAVNDIKKISSTFYDCQAFYFDEFMPTDNRYLKDEIDLLYNIYKSVCRGGGSAIRYVPVYMASNTLSIANPYFKAWGITSKIQSNTKFYRGHGVVFERCEVDGLMAAHKSSAVDKALKSHLSNKYDNTWINDENSLVAKPKGWGRSRYIATLMYGDETFGVHEYYQMNYIYISRTVDASCPHIYNLTFDNGNLNVPVINTSVLIQFLKSKYFLGVVRVQDSSIQSILQEVM